MTTLSYVTPQLPYIVPMLLVYLVGMVLALVNLKRHPMPAGFTLMGCGLLTLITAVFPFVQGYLVVSRIDRGWTNDEMQRWFLVVGVVRSLFHVVAFSLLLVAVFAGRRPPASPGGGPDDDLSEAAGEPHRATLVLVLGILSLVVCTPLGIAAWFMGSNDLAAMRAGRMDRSGASLTRVGYILGIIATVLFGVGIGATVLWFTLIVPTLQAGR